MSTQQSTEEHYIIIGGTNYQTVFDASMYGHDILIRGKFEWDPEVPSKVKCIDFILDNLNNIENIHYLNEAHWCANQNRIELHLHVNRSDEVRSTASRTIPNGFDFEEIGEMELVLRIDGNPEVCEEFALFRPNKNESYIYGDKQKDKDGAILIGMSRPRGVFHL